MDLTTLSRKELQALAKEFQLCRGNAKSDVILQHVQEFVRANPSDGEQRVQTTLASMNEGGAAPAAATPVPRAKEVVVTAKRAESVAVAASKALAKAAKIVTPRKEEVVVAVSETVKKTPEPKARKAPVKPAAVAGNASAKKTQLPEKKSSVNESPAAKQVTVKEDAKPASASKKTPPKKAPGVVQKSPAKETPAKKSPAKETSSKQSRPVLASLDTNVVKNQANKVSKHVTVDSLVSSIDDLAFAGDGSKVRCTTTGHEMKADKDVITAYINGKSYQRARLQKQSFASYAPMFTAHPDEKKAHLLWCHVTETEHPREVARVEAHISAARYQKELSRWQEEEAARVKATAEAEARAAAKAKARAEKAKQLSASENKKKRKARHDKEKSSSSPVETTEGEERRRPRARVQK